MTSMVKLENTSCAVCGKSSETELFHKNSFRIVKCNECGLVYVNPRLSKQDVSDLYNWNLISPLQYYRENQEGDYITFQERVKEIERLYGKKGTMLDIGCNIGTFLKAAKELGWDCYGVDINKEVEEECRKIGMKFFSAPLEEIKFKEEFFDVIIMNDLIEHMHDPRELLNHAYALLKKEGLIFIVTPDVGSITAHLLSKKWHHLKPNEHLIYFSKATIKRLLEECRFTIISAKHVSRWRKISTIVAKSESLLGFVPPINKILPQRITKIAIPFNAYDELCVIAKKR